MISAQLSDWLLDSDPALRWQVERDLLGADEETWQATRAKVVDEGFGAELLSHQDADGQWAGGASFPFDDDGSQPWTATTWVLKDLREWGVAASALEGTAEKLASARWEYDDLPYWGGEVDVCINSWTLSNGLWLGADVDSLVDWFLDHQLPDGGWSCEWVEGSMRSSFHSTLNALAALLDYEKVTGDRARVDVRGPGERSISSPGTEAVEMLRTRRSDDGTWNQDHRLDGDVWFHVDVPPGEASKWVTLQAQRVLDWWDSSGNVSVTGAEPPR